MAPVIRRQASPKRAAIRPTAPVRPRPVDINKRLRWEYVDISDIAPYEFNARDNEKAIPAVWKTHAHHWLILHGRYVCKARKPECWRCMIAEHCGFNAKTSSP